MYEACKHLSGVLEVQKFLYNEFFGVHNTIYEVPCFLFYVSSIVAVFFPSLLSTDIPYPISLQGVHRKHTIHQTNLDDNW